MEFDELSECVDKGMTYNEMSDHFGKSNTTIRYWLVKYELKVRRCRRRSKLYKLSKAEWQKLLNTCDSHSEILRVVGVSPNATHNRRILKNVIREFGLVDLKYDPMSRGKPLRVTEEVFLERLKQDVQYHSHWKKFIIRFGLLDHTQCSICCQSNIWNGSELVLQIDHIDGNTRNNTLKNLRFVCPNCHTQTDTFCSRNKNKIPN